MTEDSDGTVERLGFSVSVSTHVSYSRPTIAMVFRISRILSILLAISYVLELAHGAHSARSRVLNPKNCLHEERTSPLIKTQAGRNEISGGGAARGRHQMTEKKYGVIVSIKQYASELTFADLFSKVSGRRCGLEGAHFSPIL